MSRNRKEFTGSILKKLEEAMDAIEFCNQTKATFQGVLRKDSIIQLIGKGKNSHYELTNHTRG